MTDERSRWTTLGAVLDRRARRLTAPLAAPGSRWVARAATIEGGYARMRPIVAFADPVAPPPAAFASRRGPLEEPDRRGPLVLPAPDDGSAGLGASFTLDSRITRLLARLLGRTFPAVRVHTGTAADRAVRAERADALTVGNRLLFRAGAFRPQRPEGMALIGHELTHAAARVTRRQPPGSPDPGEEQALAAERTVLGRLAPAAQPGPGAPVTPAPRPPLTLGAGATPSPPGPAATRPPAAPQGRDLTPPPTAPADDTRPATPQLGDITEAVYRDLMDRIRTDFERGG